MGLRLFAFDLLNVISLVFQVFTANFSRELTVFTASSPPCIPPYIQRSLEMTTPFALVFESMEHRAGHTSSVDEVNVLVEILKHAGKARLGLTAEDLRHLRSLSLVGLCFAHGPFG